MKKSFGIIANGQALPNVTLTTFGTDRDYKQAEEISNRKNIEGQSARDQVLSSVMTRGLRTRIAAQGAEEVRLFPSVE